MIKYKRNETAFKSAVFPYHVTSKVLQGTVTKKCNAGFSNGRLSGEINIICSFYAISKEEDILWIKIKCLWLNVKKNSSVYV